MHVKSLIKFTLILGLILLTQSIIFGQGNKVSNSFANNISIKKQPFDLKINFPEVEGWEKDDIQNYPTPALGYSINYESEDGGRVTVYVYNGGRAKIPNDVSHKVLKDEINKAKSEIYQVEKLGHYKNVKEVKNRTMVLGGEAGKVESLHILFSFEAGANKLTSEIYLFGFENHFIKIRATRLYEDENTKNEAIETLLAEMDKLFSGKETVASVRN